MRAGYFVYPMASRICIWQNSSFVNPSTMYPPFSVPSPHLFPSYPPICFPRRRHLYQPTSITVGLWTALLYMYVLGLVRVGCITLAPAFTPVPAAMSIVAAGPMTLTSDVSPLPSVTLAMSSASVLLLCSPFLVVTPTSSTNLPLPSVGIGLVVCPAVV